MLQDYPFRRCHIQLFWVNWSKVDETKLPKLWIDGKRIHTSFPSIGSRGVLSFYGAPPWRYNGCNYSLCYQTNTRNKTAKKQQVKTATTRVYTFTAWSIWFRNYYVAHAFVVCNIQWVCDVFEWNILLSQISNTSHTQMIFASTGTRLV